MYTLYQAKKEAFTALKKHIGKQFPLTIDMLATPPRPEYGDISFPCFQMAKGMGRNPAEIASELAAKIAPTPLIRRITATGPYVNFIFDMQAFSAGVIKEILTQKKRYGKGSTGKGKRVMVEYANLNTHKEVHVGHLRNLVLGQSVVEIMRSNGYEVIPVAYINDLGNNVARCLWGILTMYPDVQPPEGEYLNFLGRVYTEATLALDANPEKRDEVSRIQRDLEDMQGPHVALWKKTQKWSMDNLRDVYKEFNLELDRMYVEHELIGETHDIVKRLLTDGIAKMSEGAAIVDLSDEGLGVNLLRKSDGTLLYNAKDLALAYRKEDDYHVDRSIYVVDTRQSLALRQLGATLKLMKFSREIIHLPYEFVTLPEGAMSSRKGNIVRWNDIRDAMLEKLRASITDRHADWKEKQRDKVAQSLLFASIKFGLLKQDPDKAITFSLDEAMSVEGFTGPYVMYTVARLSSILKKATVKPAKTITHEIGDEEKELITLLAKYPEVVLQAGMTLKPSLIAQFAFELAQAYAHYYERVRILDAANETATASRLALCQALRQVLENALAILGITALEEM